MKEFLVGFLLVLLTLFILGDFALGERLSGLFLLGTILSLLLCEDNPKPIVLWRD